MLKLNNRGWGFSTFVAFIAVFLIAITLISIGVINMGLTNKGPVSSLPITEVSPVPTPKPTPSSEKEDYSEQIKEYEKQFKDVATSYIKENFNDLKNDDSLSFSLVDFVEANYINKLQFGDNSCTGYAVVEHKSNKNFYSVYIKCGVIYTTVGYNTEFDKEFK